MQIFSATLVHSESKSDEVPITVGEVSQLCHILYDNNYIYTQFNFGEIAGFSTASVELLFSPNEVGEYSQHFQIAFSHPSVAPVSQTTIGTSLTKI